MRNSKQNDSSTPRSLSRTSEPDGRYLVSRPQPLGLMPTLWFWGKKENYRKGAPFILGINTLLYTFVLSQLSLGAVGGGLAGGASVLLSFGLFERFVRWRVAVRRKRLAAATPQDDAHEPRP